jgi:hypothetical protein
MNSSKILQADFPPSASLDMAGFFGINSGNNQAHSLF